MPPNGKSSSSSSSNGAGSTGAPPASLSAQPSLPVPIPIPYPPMPGTTGAVPNHLGLGIGAIGNPYLPFFLHLQQQQQHHPMTHRQNQNPPQGPTPAPAPKPQSAASMAAARRQRTQAATAARMLRAKSSVVSSTPASSPAPSNGTKPSHSASRNTDHHPHSSVPLSATLRSSATPATQVHGCEQSQIQSQSQSHGGLAASRSTLPSNAATPETRSPLIHSSLPAASQGRQRVNRHAPTPASVAAQSQRPSHVPPPPPPPLPPPPSTAPLVAVKIEPSSQAQPAPGTLTPPLHPPSVPADTDPHVALAIWRTVFDMHGIAAPPMPANLSAPPAAHQPPPPLPRARPPPPPPPPLVTPPAMATPSEHTHHVLPPHHLSHLPSQPHFGSNHQSIVVDDDEGDVDADGDGDHEDDVHGTGLSADTHQPNAQLPMPAADPQQELRKERKVNREQERRMKIKETTRKLGEAVGLPRQANMLVVLTHALEHIQTTRSQADELKTLKEALLLEGIEYDDLITRAKARRSMQDAERVLSKPLSRSAHGSSTAPGGSHSAAPTEGTNGHSHDYGDDEARMVVDPVPDKRKSSRTRAKPPRSTTAPGPMLDNSTSAVDVADALLSLRGSSTMSSTRRALPQQHGGSVSSAVSSTNQLAQSPMQMRHGRPHGHLQHQHQQPHEPLAAPRPSFPPPRHRQDSPIYIDHDDDERPPHQAKVHESSFSLSPLFGAAVTPFNTDHTDEEDMMIVDDEQPPPHRPHQQAQKPRKQRVNGIVGSSVELDPWTPAPSAPPPLLAAPSSAPLHPPISLPPPPPPSELPMPAGTDFASSLPPGPLTASIINAFAAAAAAAMAASHASSTPPSITPAPPALAFVDAPSHPSAPLPASVPVPGAASNPFAAAGFPFWPLHPPLPVTSSQVSRQPPLFATSAQLTTNDDENGPSAATQKATDVPPPPPSAAQTSQPLPPAPPRKPLAAQALESANGSPVVISTGKQQPAKAQVPPPMRGAAGNPLKARSVFPSASSSSTAATTTGSSATNTQARHLPYPAAGPPRRAPPASTKSTSAPPLPPPSSRPNPYAKLAPAPPASLAKRSSLDRPSSTTPAHPTAARAHAQAPPPPLSATKSSRNSGSSASTGTSGGAGGLLSTTANASSSTSLSAAAALASANAPGTPTKGVRLDIFALDEDDEMTSASRAKRGLSGTATSASGKEGIGRRRALDKNKSLSVDCLGDSLSAGGVKQASAENTRASAPTSTSSSSLVDELDMLLGCGVIPHQPSILAASEAPAHGAVSTHLADHAVLGDVYGTPQVESDAAAAIIVDMILGQGEGHAHHHAPVAAASAHCGSGPRDATPAPEWDPLDWLTGGSAQNAPSSVSSGPVATGWVADKENTAPAPHSASHGATGTESRRIGDAAKAAHESAVGMVEWDIDRILMGS